MLDSAIAAVLAPRTLLCEADEQWQLGTTPAALTRTLEACAWPACMYACIDENGYVHACMHACMQRNTHTHGMYTDMYTYTYTCAQECVVLAERGCGASSSSSSPSATAARSRVHALITNARELQAALAEGRRYVEACREGCRKLQVPLPEEW